MDDDRGRPGSISDRWRSARQAPADERELVRRVLSGDREAFRLVVLRYQQPLAELVYRQTGDRAAVEDVVQETFLRAYRALDRFDPRWRLSTWLSRIALNTARDLGRRKKVRDAAEPNDLALRATPDDPADRVARNEAASSVTQALATLPDTQREVVVLSVWGGLSQREIAETLEVPLGTVKTRQRTALHRLRQLVAPLFPGGAA